MTKIRKTMWKKSIFNTQNESKIWKMIVEIVFQCFPSIIILFWSLPQNLWFGVNPSTMKSISKSKFIKYPSFLTIFRLIWYTIVSFVVHSLHAGRNRPKTEQETIAYHISRNNVKKPRFFNYLMVLCGSENETPSIRITIVINLQWCIDNPVTVSIYAQVCVYICRVYYIEEQACSLKFIFYI